MSNIVKTGSLLSDFTPLNFIDCERINSTEFHSGVISGDIPAYFRISPLTIVGAARVFFGRRGKQKGVTIEHVQIKELPTEARGGLIRLNEIDTMELLSKGSINKSVGFCSDGITRIKFPLREITTDNVFFRDTDLNGPVQAKAKPKREKLRDRIIIDFIKTYYIQHQQKPAWNNLMQYLRKVSEFNGGESKVIYEVTESHLRYINSKGEISEQKLKSLKTHFCKLKKSAMQEMEFAA